MNAKYLCIIKDELNMLVIEQKKLPATKTGS